MGLDVGLHSGRPLGEVSNLSEIWGAAAVFRPARVALAVQDVS